MRRVVPLAVIGVLLTSAVHDAIAQSSPGGASSTKGAISGQVLTETGEPILNTVITLRQVGRELEFPRQAYSDEEGRFSVDGLRRGSYLIDAYARGYTRETEQEERCYRVGDFATLKFIRGGVITGTVTNASGESVIGVRVRAIRVRSLDGHPIPDELAGERKSDDRGEYRIFSLKPGYYVVVANPAPRYVGSDTAYGDESPTYYPSTTRVAATVISVQNGQEASGINIRYRNDIGKTVAGSVAARSGRDTKAPADSRDQTEVVLKSVVTGLPEARQFFLPGSHEQSFAFHGVPNGEYEVAATVTTNGNDLAQASRRVTVRGADLIGVDLTPVPLGSVSGQLHLEPVPDALRKNCLDERQPLIQETVITAKSAEALVDQPGNFAAMGSRKAVNEAGQFVVGGLTPGRYRIHAELPGDYWWVKSVALPASSEESARKGNLVSTDIGIGTGQQIVGLGVSVAQSGAVISGRVQSANENKSFPPGLRLHLVPAESQAADDVLRFYEAELEADSTFRVPHVAPGRYRVIARPPGMEWLKGRRPHAWNAEGRRQLQRDAANAGAIDLAPCQRLTDYVLQVAAPAATAKPRPSM